jgi:hypothetical protein
MALFGATLLNGLDKKDQPKFNQIIRPEVFENAYAADADKTKETTKKESEDDTKKEDTKASQADRVLDTVKTLQLAALLLPTLQQQKDNLAKQQEAARQVETGGPGINKVQPAAKTA